jgi:chromosome segregation ATPase
MSWQDILTILVPLFAYQTWIFTRIEKRFEAVDKRFEAVDRRFDAVDRRFDEVDQQLQSLDRRLTRLEGRFDERGYWEAREWHKNGTEDKQ